MNQNDLWDEYANLPSKAQVQVADFIALLHRRYGSRTNEEQTPQPSLMQESFIGIWQDREEMQDSSQWVRDARKREWQ